MDSHKPVTFTLEEVALMACMQFAPGRHHTAGELGFISGYILLKVQEAARDGQLPLSEACLTDYASSTVAHDDAAAWFKARGETLPSTRPKRRTRYAAEVRIIGLEAELAALRKPLPK